MISDDVLDAKVYMKQFVNVLVVLLLHFGPRNEVNAQGAYLEPGTSGFGLVASGLVADSGKGLDLQFGYSISGMADIGFSVGRFSADKSDIGGVDLNATGYGPSFSLYALRQSEYVPLSIQVAAGYTVVRYDGDELDQLDWDMRGRSWGIGAEIIRSIPLGQGNYFVPSFGVGHVNIKTKLEDRFGDSISDTEGVTSFVTGFGIQLNMEGSGSMYIEPGIRFDENETSFLFSIGFILETPSSPSSRSPFYKSPAERTVPPTQPERKWTRTPPERSSASQPEVEHTTHVYTVIPETDLQAMRGKTTALAQTPYSELTPQQLQALSRAFKIPASSITSLRWGTSTAPSNHPHYQSTFFVIEHGDESYQARETLRVNPFGEVLEQKKE